jgi:hypothetical protein
MIDKMRSSRGKCSSDESTNFLEYQGFNNASSSVNTRESLDNESLDRNSGFAKKTKII